MDHRSQEPVYLQIAGIIRGRIETGRASGRETGKSYPPGAPVPSIERIRQETGCAVMTIRRAMAVLEEEGQIIIVPGKGTFVTRQAGGG